MKISMKLDSERLKVAPNLGVYEYSFLPKEIEDIYAYYLKEKKRLEDEEKKAEAKKKASSSGSSWGGFGNGAGSHDRQYWEDFFKEASEQEKARKSQKDRSYNSNYSSNTGGYSSTKKKKYPGTELPDCYVDLGLTKHPATKAEIDKAYKKKLLTCHPDKPGGNRELFDMVTAAKDEALSMVR